MGWRCGDSFTSSTKAAMMPLNSEEFAESKNSRGAAISRSLASILTTGRKSWATMGTSWNTAPDYSDLWSWPSSRRSMRTNCSRTHHDISQWCRNKTQLLQTREVADFTRRPTGSSARANALRGQQPGSGYDGMAIRDDAEHAPVPSTSPLAEEDVPPWARDPLEPAVSVGPATSEEAYRPSHGATQEDQ